jgi:hypothetical protein
LKLLQAQHFVWDLQYLMIFEFLCFIYFLSQS